MTTASLHLALTVRDLDASVAFYQGLFDLVPAKHHPDYAKFELADPPLVLSLNPGLPDVATPRLSHAGLRFSSTEAFEAMRQRLQAAGIPGRVEEDTVCCYARADKTWVADPDGNEWELYVMFEDAPVHSSPAKEAAASSSGACCAPTPVQQDTLDPAAAESGLMLRRGAGSGPTFLSIR